jgi:hypothetical protein
MIQVVHKRRGVSATKRVIDLTKAAPRPATMPPAKPEPKQPLVPDGPPIAADLPEGHRQMKGGPIKNPLHDKQIEILNEIIETAGEGHPKTLGLRLILAASEHRSAAAWPLGMLSKALRLSDRPTEADAVNRVAMGCRVSRYRDMAANALALLNQKIAEGSA